MGRARGGGGRGASPGLLLLLLAHVLLYHCHGALISARVILSAQVLRRAAYGSSGCTYMPTGPEMISLAKQQQTLHIALNGLAGGGVGRAGVEGRLSASAEFHHVHGDKTRQLCQDVSACLLHLRMSGLNVDALPMQLNMQQILVRIKI